MIETLKIDTNSGIFAKKHNAYHTRESSQQGKAVEKLPEILFISSYPPRECGIAAYSQDLIAALNNKFDGSFITKIAALETTGDSHTYTKEAVDYILKTDKQSSYAQLSKDINTNTELKLIVIQHEFGLFKTNEADFITFLQAIKKPIILVFHTIFPNPDALLKKNVQQMDALVNSFIVMTGGSAKVLHEDYDIAMAKMTVIPHGTHLVKHTNKEILKKKYNLSGKKILSTFGLLNSGKSITTTLEALPAIATVNPEVVFLIIGKTHPSILEKEGEKYRESLENKIKKLGIEKHVKFINSYLPLHTLLDYLQLTDIYLFTSNDHNQAVSGTFSYAISCGCPVVSTPIPHALELLQDGGGIIVDFGDTGQLQKEVILLLNNGKRRRDISSKGLHKLAPTSWENTAIAHAMLFEELLGNKLKLHYKNPDINLEHLKELTTPKGMIQFSIINHPNLKTGYTLDDNSRALVAMLMHYDLTKDKKDLPYLYLYSNFIHFCLQEKGIFLNYVDSSSNFTPQNNENLEDSNGRAIWALGVLISMEKILPNTLIQNARKTVDAALKNVSNITSSRAMAFIIKGIYYSTKNKPDSESITMIRLLSNRLVQMYKHESKADWKWFESYLTYGNSILSEAMLCAYLATGDLVYNKMAKKSFNFLLSKIMTASKIKVISNKGWLHYNEKREKEVVGGEQPIDVAYTILALDRFFETFRDKSYLQKMEVAFSWFLGNNHLHQIVYNPCTGGCYDGLEENYINLNQGAESTVSYLMARLTVEKYSKQENNAMNPFAMKSKNGNLQVRRDS